MKGEAAAAVVAIEHVVRGGKYTLPPLTLEFLVKSPTYERHENKEDELSADDSSKALSFSHAPSFVPRYREAIKRISKTSRDLFPQMMPSFEGVRQGLGDCPFVSTVGALVHRDPSFIKKMISENGNGSFTVSFGDGQSIKLNQITDGDIGMWTSAGTNGLWLTVLEKAYRRALLQAKIPHKSQEEKDAESIYDQFGSGHTVQIFTGHEILRVELKDIKHGTEKYVSLCQKLKTTLANHLIIKASTSKQAGTKVPHVAGGHAYAVLAYDQKSDTLEVFNPWGNTFVPGGEDGFQNGYTTKGGIFHVPLREAIHIFDAFQFEALNPVQN